MIPTLTEIGERRPPMAGQVLARTDFDDSYDTDRTITADLAAANLITSMVAGPEDLHKVVIDVDLPVQVVASSTPGHFHLYIDKAMEWDTYLALLHAFMNAGIVEAGYVAAAERRGHTAVRLPWVRKPTALPVPLPACPGCQSIDRSQRYLVACGLPCDYAWHETAPACTHGADCREHPDVNGLHNLDEPAARCGCDGHAAVARIAARGAAPPPACMD